jgi:hypothetical protein
MIRHVEMPRASVLKASRCCPSPPAETTTQILRPLALILDMGGRGYTPYLAGEIRLLRYRHYRGTGNFLRTGQELNQGVEARPVPNEDRRIPVALAAIKLHLCPPTNPQVKRVLVGLFGATCISLTTQGPPKPMTSMAWPMSWCASARRPSAMAT